MTGRSQGGMGRTRLASGESAAAYMEDVAALVEVSRDPALRQWESSVVNNDADGARWVQAQQ